MVVPAYNEAAEIGACLRSLAVQDYDGDYEVIVVDNNSDDDTAAIARALGATVVAELRAGVCWARQRGTEAARGEIVVSTDADTTFDRQWLTRVDATFEATPGSVAVAGPCRFTDGPWWATTYTTMLFGMVNLIYRLTGRVLYVTATNIAFRKDAWTGYDTQLTQGGDELDLLRRLRERGRVCFELGNTTHTSARRLHRGLVYNVFVTVAFYYFLGYVLNRLCRRRVLGTAPHIRGAQPNWQETWVRRAMATGVVLGAVLVASRLGVDLA